LSTHHQVPPKFFTVNDAVAYSGVSRSSLYQLAVKRADLFKKFGGKTLVSVAALNEILDELPSGPSSSMQPQLRRRRKPPPMPEERK